MTYRLRRPASMAEPIQQVIQHVLSRTTTTYQALGAIQRRWRALVGRELAAHTSPVSLRRKRLTVVVNNPGDSFALSLRKEELLARIRTDLGYEVEDLVLRPGGSF